MTNLTLAIVVVAALVTGACTASPTAPTAPASARLTVHVTAPAFVTVTSFAVGRIGKIAADGLAVFDDLPTNDPLTVIASNSAGSTEGHVTLTGDTAMTLTLAAP